MTSLRKIFFVMLLALVVCSSYQISAQTPTNSLDVDLGSSLAFILAQRHSLEFVRNEYTSLSRRAILAESTFNVSFGVAEENIRKALRKRYKDSGIEVITAIEDSAKSTISNVGTEHISREVAETFLDEVESRAQGNIPSPILETLLAYQYEPSPAEEFIRGFTATYRTIGHAKAKGIDFQIEYPQSWQAREGKRPNIIQYFVSNNGHGLVNATILVRDIIKDLGLELTQEEIEALNSLEGSGVLASEFFAESNLREMAKNIGFSDVRDIKTNALVLDRWPGAVLSFIGNGQNLDLVLTVYSRLYIALYKKYAIFLGFYVTKSREETDKEFEDRVSKITPLFRLVAGSLIIQSQYSSEHNK